MDTTFEIDGKNYSSRPLDAFQQFHIARRLSPILGSMIMLRDKILSAADVMAPLMEGLSHMTDEDSDYVLHNCLSVVQRQVDGGQAWGPVFNKNSKRMMYDDINMSVMVNITFRVLEANLGDFMPRLPPSGGEEAPTT